MTGASSRRTGACRGGPRGLSLAAALAVLCVGSASAADDAASVEAEAVPGWNVAGEALYIYRAEDTDYVTGSLFLDRRALHLEARFNYEELGSVSAFVGWNAVFGQRLQLELTPMVGGVVGTVDGIAPALEFELSYGLLELWSENEYVLVPADRDLSFFYTWSELYLRPVDWARAGVNLQWTRYAGPGSLTELGFHAGLDIRGVSTAVYVFNPGGDTASIALLLSAEL